MKPGILPAILAVLVMFGGLGTIAFAMYQTIQSSQPARFKAPGAFTTQLEPCDARIYMETRGVFEGVRYESNEPFSNFTVTVTEQAGGKPVTTEPCLRGGYSAAGQRGQTVRTFRVERAGAYVVDVRGKKEAVFAVGPDFEPVIKRNLAFAAVGMLVAMFLSPMLGIFAIWRFVSSRKAPAIAPALASPPPAPAAPWTRKPVLRHAVGAIVCAGLLAGVFVGLFVKLSGSIDKLVQFEVPGTFEVALEPGSNKIFYEPVTTFKGTQYEARIDLNQVEFSLHEKATNAAVKYAPITSSQTYSISGRTGFALYGFEVQDAGTYVIESKSKDHAIFAVGPDLFGVGFVLTILGVVGVTFLLGGGGLILFLTALTRWLENRKHA